MIIFYATSLLGQLIWLSGSLFPYFAYNIALIGYMVMGSVLFNNTMFYLSDIN